MGKRGVKKFASRLIFRLTIVIESVYKKSSNANGVTQMTEAQIKDLQERILRCHAANRKSPNAHNITLVNEMSAKLYHATGYFFANGEWLRAATIGK